MITSLLVFFRLNIAVALVGGLVCSAGVGCGGATANLLTYAQESRQKGLREYKSGDYEAAAGSFRSATRQDPRDYKSFYYLGASYDQLGSHQQAASAYQSSLKVMDVTLEGRDDPDFRAKTIDGLGIALAKGHDRTAEVSVPDIGKKPSENAWLKAKVSRYTGDADAAVESYMQAALHDPNDFYIAKDYGLYLEELGQNETADVQLRRAYQMRPRDAEVATALRRVGTVPGPGLKDKKELARPAIPQGPLPELKMPRFGGGGTAAQQPVDPTDSTVQAPRD